MPRFYGQDSTIIVDRNKASLLNYRNKIRLQPPFPLWRHYPRYRIIPPPPPGHIWSINTWVKTENTKPTITSTTTSSTTTTTTTTTTTPKPTIFSTNASPFLTGDEFPKELLDIAQNKLGLKSLDEIPSISELGQLLGTNSPQETLNYIEQLTKNEQGIALMKAYIESADYTDSSGDLNNRNEDEKDDMDDIEEAVKANDLDLVVITDEDSNNDYELNEEREAEESATKTPKSLQKYKEMPKTHQGFIERIANFMHLDNLFDNNTLEQQRNVNENTDNEQTRLTAMEKKVVKNMKSVSNDVLENQTESENVEEKETNGNRNLNSSIKVRESSIPYNYPVPIRVSSSTTTTLSPSFINSFNSNKTSVVHLNTPKILLPHVQQISRVTKIPTNKIEDFLASKPKLLELATKVSRFPINYDRNSPVEAQVMAAVQKAILQDEDLKKLLSSTSTLK